jgi:hypothetical protein
MRNNPHGAPVGAAHRWILPMRRSLLLIVCLSAMSVGAVAHAQSSSQAEDDARRRAQADAERKKAEKAKQWTLPQASLPSVRNVGPCPFVKVLYDAGRYQEFKGAEAAANVGFTGEIQGIQAECQYQAAEPIRVKVAVNFAMGRGPQAGGSAKDYTYWVAVTERNASVLAKEYFTVRADFPEGQDRIALVDQIDEITIPRARETVSGSNFEILVGFDVTPEMAEFNRLGKRFRVNAVAPVQQAAATAAAGR